MRSVKSFVSGLGLLGLLWAGAPAQAEDVEKRFRIGVAAGVFNSQDEVPSDAANDLFLLDDNLQIVNFFTDPRDDSAVFGNLEIKPGGTATLYGQYAVSKLFLIEASIGYQKTDVGDVEVQVQFDGVDIPEIERFLFTTYRIPVGELERVPLQVTALARFRPRTSFNPYVGAGIGYTFIGFETDPEFDDLSRNMDASRGGQAILTSAFIGNASFLPAPGEQIGDLEGAAIDARDTWEWHLAGGAELSFKRKWVLFLDFRYTLSSRSLEIGFNNQKDLGRAVPNFTDFEDSEAGTTLYGAMQVTDGGLIDGGGLAPEQGQPPDTDCVAEPAKCTFVFEPDGELDTGFYYAQGGGVDYGGFSAQLGVRFTF